MFNKIYLFGILFFSLTLLNCQTSTNNKEPKITFKVSKKDKDWKEELSPEEYEILRNKGTERPNTGIYNMHFEDIFIMSRINRHENNTEESLTLISKDSKY